MFYLSFFFEKSSVEKYDQVVPLVNCGKCPNSECGRNVHVFESLEQLANLGRPSIKVLNTFQNDVSSERCSNKE